MASRKTLVAEIWCPRCKTPEGQIWEKEVRPGFFEHSTTPAKMKQRCSMCEGVLERK